MSENKSSSLDNFFDDTPLRNTSPKDLHYKPDNRTAKAKGVFIVNFLISILFIGLLIFGIWFLFIRDDKHYIGLADARDFWLPNGGSVGVIYCGDVFNNPDCDHSKVAQSRVVYLGRDKAPGETKWVHYLKLVAPDGSSAKVSGFCDKAATGMYSFDRFCKVTLEDELGKTIMLEVIP